MRKNLNNIARFGFVSIVLLSTLALGRGKNQKFFGGIINIRAQQLTQLEARFDVYHFFLGGLVPKDHKFRSLGSGAYIDTNLGGLVISNYHFLKNAQNFVGVEQGSGVEIELKLLGVDENLNLALLEPVGKVSWNKLSPGISSSLSIGEAVSVVASPFGIAAISVPAHVASTGGVVGTTQPDKNYYLDRSISAALSGGGVFDGRGRIVGIASAYGFDEALGLGLFIPMDRASLVLADLKKFGKVHNFWLGIIAKNIYAKEVTGGDQSLMGNYGVIVENLIAGGPAQRAGLKIGDVISSLGGKTVSDSHGLQELLMDDRIGRDKASLVIEVFRRGSGLQKIKVTIEERPKAQELPKDPDLL